MTENFEIGFSSCNKNAFSSRKVEKILIGPPKSMTGKTLKNWRKILINFELQIEKLQLLSVWLKAVQKPK